ncbi:MAG: hypothetical protein FADNKDHG_01594 [Holosporales bacterium]
MSLINIKIFLFLLTFLAWSFSLECVEFNSENAVLKPSVIVDRESKEWIELKLLYTGYIGLFRDIMNKKESAEKMDQALQGLKISAIQGYPAAKLVFNILHQCNFTKESLSLPSRGELREDEIINIIEGCIYHENALSYIKHQKIEIITQSCFADLLCVSQSTISRFLRGKPSSIIVQRVKEKLINHYRHLLFGNNNESKKDL